MQHSDFSLVTPHPVLLCEDYNTVNSAHCMLMSSTGVFCQ
jgi:hypothetical protein